METEFDQAVKVRIGESWGTSTKMESLQWMGMRRTIGVGCKDVLKFYLVYLSTNKFKIMETSGSDYKR